MKSTSAIWLVLIVLLIVTLQPQISQAAEKYEPTWESLREYKEVPKWLRDGKFGIYTHWGPYAVHAYGSNTTWYSFFLYVNPGGEERKHFEKTFGKLTPQFGYKDLIPKFTGEKFNADEWAELFAKSGAKFAGPVAEHHDGFAMWDTKYSQWNAANMGPKRDVVGELEEAIKKRNMKFVTAFHHAANWFFFPVMDKRYDTGDPKYSGLYGQPHKLGAMRNQAFLDEWYGKIIEVINNYSPDFIWFDFGLDSIPEGYVKDFLAYYYNHAEKKGKEVVVTYKDNDLVPATGVRDLELGQEPKITYHEWITDSTVDDRGAWGYANDLVFKTPDRVIDNLVDRVSKNGYLLLNVGPKPDGTIPEPARALLLEIGAWLEVNGEGIYGTSPWIIAGEGPTNLGEIQRQGFNESNTVYTGEDIRFTVKGDTIYATFLAWPGDEAVITTLRAQGLEADTQGAATVDIWTAAAKGDLEEIKQHVSVGTDLNARDNEGSTALHMAAFFGHIEVVKLLLEKGAEVNVKNNDGQTPLDAVAGEWNQGLEEIYMFLAELLQMQLDVEGIKAARPQIAALIREHVGETPSISEYESTSLVGKTLTVELAGEVYTVAFREDGEAFLSGGEVGEGVEARYEQDGENVYFWTGLDEFEATYDGEKLEHGKWEEEEEEQSSGYPGFYKEEIKRISLLGDGKDLDWRLTRKGLVIKMPDQKPCDYAYVIKIERHHHPKID